MIDLKQLEEHVISVLTKYNLPSTPQAINAILAKWYAQKKPLIKLLSKHPDWSESDLAIIQTQQIKESTIDKIAVKAFFNWIVANGKLRNTQKFWFSRMTDLRTRHKIAPYISPFLAYAINQILPETEAKNDEKTTRVFQRMCEILGLVQLPDYNKMFTNFAEGMSSRISVDNFVLSVHPVDYLLMSNGNSWSSCQSLKGGCCQSGSVSYMLDSVSMIGYVANPKKSTIPICEIPKIRRQVFVYQDKSLLQSRLYPQKNDNDQKSVILYQNYKNTVIDMLKQCLQDTEEWDSTPYHKRKTTDAQFVKREGATCYPDWNYSYSQVTVSQPKSKQHINDTISVGAKPLSIKTGLVHNNSGALWGRGER